MAVLENPLTRMAEIILTPPVHFPYGPKIKKYLQFLKKTCLAGSACLSASAVYGFVLIMALYNFVLNMATYTYIYIYTQVYSEKCIYLPHTVEPYILACAQAPVPWPRPESAAPPPREAGLDEGATVRAYCFL